MSRRLFLILITISIIIFIGFYFVSQYIFQKDKINVTISSNIQSTKIMINGKLLNNSNVYLKPGKYAITAYSSGYYEFRNNYDMSDKNNNININLIQKPEKTISELIEDGEYDYVLSQIPIIKNLPFDTFLLKILYTPESTLSSFEINIEAYEGYKTKAIDKIKDWGYDPSNFNIKFNNYENPFKL